MTGGGKIVENRCSDLLLMGAEWARWRATSQRSLQFKIDFIRCMQIKALHRTPETNIMYIYYTLISKEKEPLQIKEIHTPANSPCLPLALAHVCNETGMRTFFEISALHNP